MISTVYAATQPLVDLYKPAAALGGNTATIGGFISPLIVNALILGGILAFVTIIFAGYQYISGAGDKAKIAQAQNMLNYAIIGLVVMVAGYVITLLVGQLVGFNFLTGAKI